MEDRQYQLEVNGISISTGKWQEFVSVLDDHTVSTSHLKTMSENPALEWNNLDRSRLGSLPNLNLWQLVGR